MNTKETFGKRKREVVATPPDEEEGEKNDRTPTIVINSTIAGSPPPPNKKLRSGALDDEGINVSGRSPTTPRQEDKADDDDESDQSSERTLKRCLPFPRCRSVDNYKRLNRVQEGAYGVVRILPQVVIFLYQILIMYIEITLDAPPKIERKIKRPEKLWP